MIRSASDDQRIVITGIGLAAPNGDNLADYRAARDVWFTAHQAARHGLINSVEVLS